MKQVKFLLFRLTVVFLCLITAGCGKEQVYSKITDFEPHEFVYSSGTEDYGYYDIGVCRKLVGDVYTLVIFVDDNESSWDDDARNTFYNKRFFPSMDYIGAQAELRDVELGLQCGQYKTKSDLTPIRYSGVVDGSAEKVVNNIDIFNQVAEQLGYPDKDVMHAFMKNSTGVEQIAYVLVLNKAGRAYAVSDTTYDGKDSIEFVVAFALSESGKKDLGSTIIHEVLHLFGAADLYDPKGEYPARKELCEELYPNDIMMKASTDPEKLEIGRLTEHLIGWSDYFPPECDCPEWWETDGDTSSHRE